MLQFTIEILDVGRKLSTQMSWMFMQIDVEGLAVSEITLINWISDASTSNWGKLWMNGLRNMVLLWSGFQDMKYSKVNFCLVLANITDYVSFDGSSSDGSVSSSSSVASISMDIQIDNEIVAVNPSFTNPSNNYHFASIKGWDDQKERKIQTVLTTISVTATFILWSPLLLFICLL